MRLSKIRLCYGALIAIVSMMYGCGSDDVPTSTSPGSYDEVVKSGGGFDPVEESSEVTETTVADVVGDETFFCTTKHYSITEAPDDFVLFNPNADIIWPGNLLQGASLSKNTPSPIPVRRGPGTVVMTILNGSPAVSRNLDEVNLASISNAMNSIISTASDTLPSRFQFSAEQVYSWEHMALSLDVSVSYLSNNLSASLAFSGDREYNRFVVQLYQTFFDMAFQIPTRTADFFHPDETPENLGRYVQPGNPPAFISLVTYGRIFYLLIESTSSSTEMDASISASFRAGVVGGDLEAGATYVSDLENVKIKAFALGGNQSDALNAITSDFESLKNFLASGGQIRTGVPLSYVARSVANPDKIVNVAVAADYDVTQCVPVGESFENPIFLFRAGNDEGEPPAIDLVTEGDVQCVSAWNNLLYYEDDTRDAIPMDGYTMAGSWAATDANGKPAVTFAPPEADVGSSLGYPGLDFKENDFTVVAVARLVSTNAAYPAYFMFGNNNQDRRNLRIGFADDSRLTMTTGTQRLDADPGVLLTDWNVYTFRFSREEGMQIYVNLDDVPAASQPTATEPLISYTGARIGTSGNARIQIGEIKAYGIAFHDAQRKWAAEQLMIKYRI